jgi:hypothetical protein
MNRQRKDFTYRLTFEWAGGRETRTVYAPNKPDARAKAERMWGLRDAGAQITEVARKAA